ncbi:MAG: MG2 domain-containing protein [Candidatus Caldarchaeum sp.]
MIKAVAAILTAITLLATASAQNPLTPPTLILSTDRQIYRQGEQVIITVEALDDELKPSPNTRIILTVTDPQQQTILDIGLRTNANGTAAYTMELEANAPEGEYLIEAIDEQNIHRPAAIYFLVCNACKRPETLKTITLVNTTTTTLPTTTTTTLRTTQTTTTTELILTSDLLLSSIFVVIVAIFAFQIIASRRIFTQRA